MHRRVFVKFEAKQAARLKGLTNWKARSMCTTHPKRSESGRSDWKVPSSLLPNVRQTRRLSPILQIGALNFRVERLYRKSMLVTRWILSALNLGDSNKKDQRAIRGALSNIEHNSERFNTLNVTVFTDGDRYKLLNSITPVNNTTKQLHRRIIEYFYRLDVCSNRNT